MNGYKNILFPVDFSGVSEQIAAHVLFMAKKFHSTIHLLYVAKDLTAYSEMNMPEIMILKFEENLYPVSERRLDAFRSTYFKDYEKVKSYVAIGKISEEILSYVDSEKIDIVAMATHGRKGLEKIFIPSIAKKIVLTSPVPVLLINPEKHLLQDSISGQGGHCVSVEHRWIDTPYEDKRNRCRPTHFDIYGVSCFARCNIANHVF